MSYPVDTSEISSAKLLGELRFRKDKMDQGICPYCLNPIKTHTCKFRGYEEYFKVSTDLSLTFSEFSLINLERCQSDKGFNHKLSSWSLSDWFLAFVGEVGEAANIGKKLNRVRDGIPGNKETPEDLELALRRELADAFIYLDLLCQSQGFKVGDIIMEVFDAKSEQIGYKR